MDHYVYNEYTVPRVGATGTSRGAEPTQRRRRVRASARGLSSALLATVLSALIVAADRMVDAWSGGGLALALLVLWLVVFAGLVLFARATARFSLRLARAWRAWSDEAAQEHADTQLMELARKDARVLADVNAALKRDEPAGLTERMGVPVYYRPW